MDQPAATLRLLRPRPADPHTRRLANTKAGPGPIRKPDPDDGSYSDIALRTAIKYLHQLPPDLPIILDLKRVYPLIGRKWQNVWDLYAQGFKLGDIGNWAYSVHFRKSYFSRDRSDSNRGNDLVTALVQEVRFYLDLDVENVVLAGLVGIDDAGNLQHER